jgi:uncharacterized metal-binding protein YceD (DUF177 family)
MLDQTVPARKATLSLIVDINEVRDQEGLVINLQATKAECAELAEQLDILGIDEIKALISLRKGARSDLFEIEAQLDAKVVQACSVTLNPVKETVQESFFEMLTTSAEALGDEDDAESDKPIELIEHGKIDVGAIVAQWLALSLDPFPRSDAPPYEHIEAANGNREDTHRPFEILDKIKDK